MLDEDQPTEAERERYERVKARVGISNLDSGKRFRERNAVAASTGSLNGQRKPRSSRAGNWSFGRDQ